MPANASQTKRLPVLVSSMCELLSAGRGLDCAEINRTLLDDHGIMLVIDTRALWRDERREQRRDLSQPIAWPLYPDRAGNIVYDERGTVYCCCPGTGEVRQMACRGFEQDRHAIGYRCPAAAHGLVCKGGLQCEMEALGRQTSCGRIVRVSLGLRLA